MAPSNVLSKSATPNPTEGFVFATCYPASNGWLRRDVARYHPQLRLAFSAPGLVTWKGLVDSEVELASPLAVIAGIGVGRATSAEEVTRLVVECATKLQRRRLPLLLHVFHTARDVESTEGNEDVLAAALEVETNLRQAFPFAQGPTAPGTPIVDVVHLRDKPGSYFVGWHHQRSDRPTRVGGVETKALDPRSPSRAYSKAWELLRLGELDLQGGETVIELGAAPGGGTIAWLEQKAAVVAVDPAEMSPIVAEVAAENGASYRHIQKSAGDLDASDLPSRVDYLYSDMNLAPAVVARYVERCCALVEPPRRAILMNLKVNDEKVEVNLNALLGRLSAFSRRIGCEMRVAQLPSHRKEIGVVLRRNQSAKTKGRAKAK